MTEPFIITVNHLGTEHEFKARFERWGYTHRIAVLIDEVTVFFGPDVEGGYRALVDMGATIAATVPQVNLLKSVAEKLAALRV